MELILLTLIGLLISAQTKAQPAPVRLQFQQTPRKTNEGTAAASFICRITQESRSGLYQATDLQILHNGNKIISIDGLRSDITQMRRYILMVAEIEAGFSVRLDIQDVSRNDAGAYTFKVTHSSVFQMTEVEATTTFEVNYLPDAEYPHCSTLGELTSQPIRPGKNVTFICFSGNAKPTIDLNWSYANRTDVISENRTESEDFVRQEVTIAVLHSDEDANFRCEATSPAFPEYSSTCALNPLNVAPPINDTSDDRTTESDSGPSSSTTMSSDDDNINEDDDQSTTTSSLFPSNNTSMIIVIVVLAALLLLSIALNILCAVRRRKAPLMKNIPETKLEDNYQGLSKVEQGDVYTALTTPPISLQTINKKSKVTEPVQQTGDDEDYAQVDVSHTSPQNGAGLQEDSKYVNYNKKLREKIP